MARSALNTPRAPAIPTWLTALFPRSFIEIARRRIVEFIGAGLIILALALSVALLTYHHADPSFNSAADGPAKNVIGLVGSYTADIM